MARVPLTTQLHGTPKIRMSGVTHPLMPKCLMACPKSNFYLFCFIISSSGRQYLTEGFSAFSSVIRQTPGYNSQRRGTASTLPKICVVLCIVSFVSFYVLFVCKCVLYCTVLYCTVLYCTVLHCTVLYCTLLYCTVLYCTVLYCTVLHCTVLYCTVLYCTVLYCTVLHCTVL